MKPSLPTRRLRSRPGCAAASMAGGTGWRVPARRAGRPGLVSSRMKGSWSRVAEGCGNPCSQPPLTWRVPAIDLWPPSRGPPVDLAPTSRGPGSDLAPGGQRPGPGREPGAPGAGGVKFAAGLLFHGQVHERSTAGTREVHGLWYARPRSKFPVNLAWQPGDMPGCGDRDPWPP
jgi:hypothetical protein